MIRRVELSLFIGERRWGSCARMSASTLPHPTSLPRRTSECVIRPRLRHHHSSRTPVAIPDVALQDRTGAKQRVVGAALCASEPRVGRVIDVRHVRVLYSATNLHNDVRTVRASLRYVFPTPFTLPSRVALTNSVHASDTAAAW